MSKHNKTNTARVHYYRLRLKMALIEAHGGKCKKCGFAEKVPPAYDFHHIDPKEKEFGIGNSDSKNFDQLLEETKKCLLVCKNCHAKIYWENMESRRKRYVEIAKDHVFNPLLPVICKSCKKEFMPTVRKAKFCSVACSHFSQRRGTWPDKSEFSKDAEFLSLRAAGKKYGVSGNTIKEWAKSMGIKWVDKRKLSKIQGHSSDRLEHSVVTRKVAGSSPAGPAI